MLLEWLEPVVVQSVRREAYRQEIVPEQVSLLYRNATLAYSVTIVNASILVVVQSGTIPARFSLAWMGCLLLVTAGRVASVWLYRRDPLADRHARFWGSVYVLGAGLAGLVWGSAAIFLFPPASPAHQVFVAFVLAGMSAGAVGVLAARLEACLAFLLPALLPLAFRFFTGGGEIHAAMGVMTLIFLGGMLVTGWSLNRSVVSTLSLRYDNNELASQIHQRRTAEEELFREKDRLQTTLTSLGEGVVITDSDRRIEYMNPVMEQFCGWPLNEAARRDIDEVLTVYGDDGEATVTALEAAMVEGRRVRKKVRMDTRNGSGVAVEEVATPLCDRHGEIIGGVAVLHDVTDVQVLTEELAFAANHDPLTGLPNRHLLQERINSCLARAHRRGNHFGLLFLDLDRFKDVNDNLGHEAGDALLREVALRLTTCIRQEDTVARLGGDEFVVLLDTTRSRRSLDTVAEKVIVALSEPYSLDDHRVAVSVSVGESLYPDDGEDSQSLLRCADMAMYRAKARRRGRT